MLQSRRMRCHDTDPSRALQLQGYRHRKLSAPKLEVSSRGQPAITQAQAQTDVSSTTFLFNNAAAVLVVARSPLAEGKVPLFSEDHKGSRPEQLGLIQDIACNRVERSISSCTSKVLQSLGQKEFKLLSNQLKAPSKIVVKKHKPWQATWIL